MEGLKWNLIFVVARKQSEPIATKQEENFNLLFLLNFKTVYNMLLTCPKASLYSFTLLPSSLKPDRLQFSENTYKSCAW